MRDDELLDEDAERLSWGGWILTALAWGGIAIGLHLILQRFA